MTPDGRSAADIAAYVTRLRRLDCCAVSDALDRLQLNGTVTGLNALSSARGIAGRVTTVKLAAHETIPLDDAPRHLGSRAIEACGPDDVIVVEQRTGRVAGCWGGILSLGAKVKGIAGVVADGLVRDIDEARQYDFPIFARGTTALTARGRVAEAGTHVDVTIGDILVRDGDYVIADGSGAVFIASESIESVLESAETIVRREASMAKKLLAGEPVTLVMGASYEHMLKA